MLPRYPSEFLKPHDGDTESCVWQLNSLIESCSARLCDKGEVYIFTRLSCSAAAVIHPVISVQLICEAAQEWPYFNCVVEGKMQVWTVVPHVVT